MSMSDAIEAQEGEPYPGLRSFHRDETHIFFGREDTIAEMVDRLGAHRFLAVTGLSGSGKSSLVRTGLLNALERGLLVEAGSDWRVADFRPGGRPLSRLMSALVPAIGGDYSGDERGLIEAKLARGPLGLVEWLDEIEFPNATNLLLLVDQFEEIFRYAEGRSSDETHAFVALLLASARQRNRRIYVVITMRSDFLGDCARFTDLAEMINEGQFLTPMLTRDQCRQAIEGPAAVYGGRIEPALVTRMLNDMGGNPDQLPLMQHVLMLMWQQGRARAGGHPPELTLADYEHLGGIGRANPESEAAADAGGRPSLPGRAARWIRRRFTAQPAAQRGAGTGAAPASNGALSDHADRILARLTPAQQLLAANLFRALSQREGAGGRDIRRPTTLATLASITEAPVAELIPIINEFRAPGVHFLTPPNPDPLTPDSVIDISHESLIRQWVKLRQWVREEYQSAEEYRGIERAAKQWSGGLGSLLMKVDLAVARKWRRSERPNAAWAGRYGNAFALAMTFLRKSERHRRWQRGIWGVLASTVILVILSTTTVAVYLMAVVTTGLSYVNPADEWSDFGVAPRSTMQSNVGTNTPLTIPGGRVIGTGELETALDRGTLEGVPFLAINALRNGEAQGMPGSIYIGYAGDYGAFDDDTQSKLKEELAKRTDNNVNMPLVFFCAGSKCWESYNAALRAINLGYSKVYWYRGGIFAWNAAHRQYPLDFSRIPFSFPSTIETGVRAMREAVLPDPAFFSQRGKDYVSKQQYDNAIDDFTKAISLAPENADTYFERAQAYASKQDYEHAIADFNKVAALDPPRSAEMQKILESPKFAGGYNARGNQLFNDKQYDQSIKEYDQAIKLDRSNALYFTNRGNAYSLIKDYRRALDDYGQAIMRDSKNADLYNRRGNAYFAVADYAHAVEDYGRAIEINPKNAIYFGNRGLADFRNNDFARAITDYGQAIALDSKNADYYNARASAYYQTRDYPHAIGDYTQAIALDAKNADLYNRRGNAYFANADYAHALEDYGRAIEINPKNAVYFDNRGGAYYQSKDNSHAVEAYTQAIALDPKDADYYNRRGNAYFASSDYAHAIDDYTQALKINPKAAIYLGNRANTYYLIKDFGATVDDYTAAIALDPKNAGYYYGRGAAKRDNGDLNGALADYRAGAAIAQPLLQGEATKAQAQRDIQRGAESIGGIAYRLLLKGDFGTALGAADDSTRLAPGLIWLYTNRAHALMFLGRTEQARALYLQYRGTPNVQDGKSWNAAVLGDFADLRKSGLTNPLMDEIEALFSAGG
jgi:PQQ-dependent catabolism-associated CXXCW motif protein